MFDFAWSEIALIAAVALIAIGPKDMPAAIRGVTDMIKKARRMAGEFQTHVDEMLREANLDEVRSHINEIRNFDVRGHLERAVDPDGSLRDTFATNPLEPTVPAVDIHQRWKRSRSANRRSWSWNGQRMSRRSRLQSPGAGIHSAEHAAAA